MTRSILLAIPILLAPQAAPAFVPGQQADLPVVRVFEEGITRTDQLPTAELRRLRKRMLVEEYVSFRQLRRLADAGDGLAAFRYGNKLLELDDPTVRDDAALYYASAALTGRDYAVGPLIRLLEGPEMELSSARSRHLETALRAFAKDGNTDAAEALVGFYARGAPFGRHPDRAASLLLGMAETGGAEVALTLVANSFSGESELSEARMRDLLELVVEDAQTLGQKTMARNLLTRLDNGPEDG